MATAGPVDRTNLLLEIIATELYVARADREHPEDLDLPCHNLDRELTIDNLRKMREKLSLQAIFGMSILTAESRDSAEALYAGSRSGI